MGGPAATPSTTAATSTCSAGTGGSRSRRSSGCASSRCSAAAADAAQLPADPEFRAAIMGYAEWGTRLALANSQPGARAAPHAPVPRWGWGVAPPYRPGT